jgi:hypothetical protein
LAGIWHRVKVVGSKLCWVLIALKERKQASKERVLRMGAGAAGFHLQQLDIIPGQQEVVATARGGGGVFR